MPRDGLRVSFGRRPLRQRQEQVTVFWNRTAREARRQKVLEELTELTTEERRLRMDRAVAEGDVRAGEVEEALRLVGRLDALRVMTIPGTRRAAAPVETPEAERLEPDTDDPNTHEPETVQLVTELAAPRPAIRRRRRRRRIAIAVAVETARQIQPEALDVAPGRRSAAVRDVAVRRAGRAIGGSSRRREHRLAEAMRAYYAPAVASVSATAASAGAPGVAWAAPEVVAEPSPEEQWPSIAWLRP